MDYHKQYYHDGIHYDRERLLKKIKHIEERKMENIMKGLREVNIAYEELKKIMKSIMEELTKPIPEFNINNITLLIINNRKFLEEIGILE